MSRNEHLEKLRSFEAKLDAYAEAVVAMKKPNEHLAKEVKKMTQETAK